jgi:hypothetical protein
MLQTAYHQRALTLCPGLSCRICTISSEMLLANAGGSHTEISCRRAVCFTSTTDGVKCMIHRANSVEVQIFRIRGALFSRSSTRCTKSILAWRPTASNGWRFSGGERR